MFVIFALSFPHSPMYSSAGKSSIENLHVGWAFDGVTANWSAERKKDNVRRHRIIVEMLERMAF